MRILRYARRHRATRKRKEPQPKPTPAPKPGPSQGEMLDDGSSEAIREKLERRWRDLEAELGLQSAPAVARSLWEAKGLLTDEERAYVGRKGLTDIAEEISRVRDVLTRQRTRIPLDEKDASGARIVIRSAQATFEQMTGFLSNSLATARDHVSAIGDDIDGCWRRYSRLSRRVLDEYEALGGHVRPDWKATDP